MLDIGYKEAWPDEVKEARRLYERAYYRVENLRNNVKIVAPSAFDAAMDDLEAAERALRCACAAFNNAAQAWEASTWHGLDE